MGIASMRCPKCGYTQLASPTCKSCGTAMGGSRMVQSPAPTQSRSPQPKAEKSQTVQPPPQTIPHSLSETHNENEDIKRPTSVTIISWILIISGGLSLITSIAAMNMPMVKEVMSRSPVPVPVQYVLMYVGVLISVGCGLALLKGKNWGRFLYVVSRIFGLFLGLAISPTKKIAIIPWIVVVGVIAYFLFRPKANEYFLQKSVQH